ncbi:MAG: hypothetical protein NTX61_07280 [Bacteroidetes bacterium]|nr:hypothetical protein [Bacteroidota bacterium]
MNDKKNRIKPAWEEPLWSYLPGVNRDSDSILIRSQLKEICMEENNGLLQLNIKPWAGNKLRFLFLGMEWGRERGTVRVAFIDQNSSSGQSGCFMSGYTCLKWSEDQYPLWKAEALFSQDEILSIISAIENFLTSNNSNNDASRVVNLWSNIFDKFVGGKLNYHAFLDFTPGQIMARLLGSTFEYETNDCIKKYTLRQILTNNQEVHECVKEYKFILAYHLNQLKDILFSKDLLFNVGERVYKNNNYSMYAKDSFWVPLECLP